MTVPYVNKFRPAEHALPRSWLAADYSDLIAQAETAADDPASAEEPAANFYPSPNPSPNPRPSPNPSPNPNPHPNPKVSRIVKGATKGSKLSGPLRGLAIDSHGCEHVADRHADA